MRSGRHAFFIIPELYTEEKGYVAVTVVEGLDWFYPSNLYCGHDYEMAVWYANQKNLSLGIDANTATMIIRAATTERMGGVWNTRPI